MSKLRHTSTELRIVGSSIVGRVGFDLTNESLLLLSNRIYNYLVKTKINTVYLGSDGSHWPEIFIRDVLGPRLTNLGLNLSEADKVVPFFQFTWMVSETSDPTLGVYLTTAPNGEDLVQLHFVDRKGYLPKKKVEKIYKTTSKIKSNTPDKSGSLTFLDLSRYLMYLKDKKLIDTGSVYGKRVGFDLMFGACEQIIKKAIDEFQWDLRLFNLQSNSFRLNNYSAIPTGSNLSLYVETEAVTKNCNYYFGLSPDGRKFGVWDVTQKLEISSSGVGMLLLEYLKKVRKIEKGTIAVTPAVSERVLILAKNFGYKIKIVANLEEALKGRKIPIFYMDQAGSFVFPEISRTENALIALCCVLESCHKHNKSPGGVIDLLANKYFNRQYIYNNLFLSQNYLTKEALKQAILTKQRKFNIREVDFDHPDILRLENEARIVISQDELQEVLEVYIESPTKEITLEVSNMIQDLFSDSLNV